MKYFISKLIDLIWWITASICTFLMWYPNDTCFYSFNITIKCLDSTLVGVVFILTLINCTISKRQESEIVSEYITKLDKDDDVVMLRNIRSVVNTKLKHSNINKIMIQASKDICGKNCKCKNLRKRKQCEICDVYEAYVKYLKDFAEL